MGCNSVSLKGFIMTRTKLPSRRSVWRQKAKIPDENGRYYTFYCEFGENEKGELKEIFIESAKEGTFVLGILGTLARLVSVALQCDTPLEEIVKSMKGLCYPPCGIIQSEESLVKECTSIADWIAQEIENCYLTSYKTHDMVKPSQVEEMVKVEHVKEQSASIEAKQPYLTEGWKEHGTGYYHKGSGV